MTGPPLVRADCLKRQAGHRFGWAASAGPHRALCGKYERVTSPRRGVVDNILTGSAVRHDVSMERLPLSLDELAEHWTVLDDEKYLIAGKRGPTRLGFGYY